MENERVISDQFFFRVFALFYFIFICPSNICRKTIIVGTRFTNNAISWQTAEEQENYDE